MKPLATKNQPPSNFKKSPTPPQLVPTQPREMKKKKAEPKAEVIMNEDSDMSMISHISMNEIAADNNKFDKWDILFNPDQEEEGDDPF